MIKKLLLSILFFNFIQNAHALKIATIDNFTRYTFEPSDYIVNVGQADNYSWNMSFHASLFSNSKGCSMSTVPIYIPSDFKIYAHIEIKANTSIFVDSISDLSSTNLLNVKLNYDNFEDNYSLDDGIIALSELKEVRSHANVGDSYYITAKTPGYNYVSVPINFNLHNNHPSGKISLCIGQIQKKTRLSVRNIIVDIYK